MATELKERRIECRNLSIEVSELTEAKSSLEMQVANLRSQLSHHDLDQTEKDDELERLNTKIKSSQGQLQTIQKATKERNAVGDKALMAYKKKAQASLAGANARAAAANQAREEAEIEAASARSVAEEALERAKSAESNRSNETAKSQADVNRLEEKLETLTIEFSAAKKYVDGSSEQLVLARSELKESASSRDKFIEEIEKFSQELHNEQENNIVLVQEIKEEKEKSRRLSDDAEALREDLQRSAAAAFMERQRQSQKESILDGSMVRSINGDVEDMDKRARSEVDATIIMLQQDLHGANEAIRELKEALRGALLNKPDYDEGILACNELGTHAQNPNKSIVGASSFDSEIMSENEPTKLDSTPATTNELPSNTGGNDTTPLYFALEKQAELNTARNEINRLANMLGDAESVKWKRLRAWMR